MPTMRVGRGPRHAPRSRCPAVAAAGLLAVLAAGCSDDGSPATSAGLTTIGGAAGAVTSAGGTGVVDGSVASGDPARGDPADGGTGGGGNGGGGSGEEVTPGGSSTAPSPGGATGGPSGTATSTSSGSGTPPTTSAVPATTEGGAGTTVADAGTTTTVAVPPTTVQVETLPPTTAAPTSGPCDMATVVAQTETGFDGIEPRDLRCAGTWAAWVGAALDPTTTDSFFAVAAWDGESWVLANLGTASVCSDAGVPASLWPALGCTE